MTADWPDDPPTVAEANAHPEVMAGKTVGEVADHVAELIGTLERKPVVIGHSFGGLMAQIIAGRGLAARGRGDRPGAVPRRAAAADLGAAGGTPGAGQPAQPHRAVPLTYDQFRYAFANAVSEDEAKALYEDVRRPGAGRAAVPGRGREPEPVDRGQGRHATTRTAARC